MVQVQVQVQVPGSVEGLSLRRRLKARQSLHRPRHFEVGEGVWNGRVMVRVWG